MYQRIAVITLVGGNKIVYGTDSEYLSNEEAETYIRAKRYGCSDADVSVAFAVVIPNDGHPYDI